MGVSGTPLWGSLGLLWAALVVVGEVLLPMGNSGVLGARSVVGEPGAAVGHNKVGEVPPLLLLVLLGPNGDDPRPDDLA